jgi:phosphoribosylanthranilate isomerase
VRGRTLAARGWTQDGGDLWETLARLEQDGAARYVLTDVTKDGTLTGPNIDLLKEFCAQTNKPVIASGGIATLNDLIELRQIVSIGVEGAIMGKALYAGAFKLNQALEVAGAQK